MCKLCLCRHLMFHLKVRLQAQSVYRGIFHCVAKTYSREGVGFPILFNLSAAWSCRVFTVFLSTQIHGFFRGMSFPVLTTGVLNSIIFGAYSNGLDYLSQSQRGPCRPASDAHVFTAGCFSGVVQVSSPEAVTGPDWTIGTKKKQYFSFSIEEAHMCA